MKVNRRECYWTKWKWTRQRDNSQPLPKALLLPLVDTFFLNQTIYSTLHSVVQHNSFKFYFQPERRDVALHSGGWAPCSWQPLTWGQQCNHPGELLTVNVRPFKVLGLALRSSHSQNIPILPLKYLLNFNQVGLVINNQFAYCIVRRGSQNVIAQPFSLSSVSTLYNSAHCVLYSFQTVN